MMFRKSYVLPVVVVVAVSFFCTVSGIYAAKVPCSTCRVPAIAPSTGCVQGGTCYAAVALTGYYANTVYRRACRPGNSSC